MTQYTEVRFRGSAAEVDAQWTARRKNGIGGSDLAAVMGLSPYTTPLDVWLVKTGRAESPDLSGKEAVYWGNVLEDVVARRFAELHPELVVKRRNATLVSKERPWAFANLDRTVKDEGGRMGVLEIKTAGLRRASDWEDGVPAYYLAQVVHYLGVTGWDYAWVAVLIGGQEYREYRIERDEEDVAAAVEAADAFWHDYVEADVMPGMTGMKGEGAALASMHPEPSDELLLMLDEDVDELGDLAGVKERIAALEKEKRAIEAAFKARIGDARGIETPSRRITWTRTRRASFDKKGFDAAHPGMTDAYMRQTTTDGGLRVSVRKGA